MKLFCLTKTLLVILTGARSAFTKEEIDGLKKHNDFRKVHKVPLMRLNRQLCDQAKAYAEKLARWKRLVHATLNNQGENLSYGCSSSKAQTIEEAVTNWYNEVCYPGYDFIDGPTEDGTGHFTQVVWKDSIELGIGRAVTTVNGLPCGYIVARYKPAGNYIGRHKTNVLRGDFDAADYCSKVSIDRKKLHDGRSRNETTHQISLNSRQEV